MENLNFSSFGFLSDKDKKTISFLHKDLNRNFKEYTEESFRDLFTYLSDKFGNAISLYNIYKFLYILRYDHISLDSDYVYNTPIIDNEEKYFSSSDWNVIRDYILNNDKFKTQINDIRLSFFNGCGIELYNFKSNPGINGLSVLFKISCYDNDDEQVYYDSGNFFASFKIIDNTNMEFHLDLYNLKDKEIIIPQPWGDFKNISIDGVIDLFKKTIVPYYDDFFSDYLEKMYKRYLVEFTEKNENIMKKIIKLTESDLEKIVEKIIQETQEMELLEGRKKTGTKLCARGKAAAKAKFKVWPSAYGNGFAVQVCKGRFKGLDGKKRCSPPYC